MKYKQASIMVHFFAGLSVSIAMLAGSVSATTYYISSSGGNDGNAGTSTTTAWKTLTKASTAVLAAGDQVLLKCGDSFSDGLYPQGSGTAANPIIIGSYGTGNKPLIAVGYTHQEVTGYHKGWYCIKLVGVAGYKIKDLEFRNSACGISAWYNNTYNNNYLWIENCFFHNMTSDALCWPSGVACQGNPDPAEDMMTPTGVAIAGVSGNRNASTQTVLKNVTLKNCVFDSIDVGFCSLPVGFTNGNYTSTAGYMHNCPVWGVTDSMFSNVTLDRCVFYRNYRSAAIYLNAVGNSIVKNCTCDENGYQKGFWWGTAAIQFNRNKNVTVDSCIVRYEQRPNCANGEAFDWEVEDNNCTVKNCVIEYCDGSAAVSVGNNYDWAGWTGVNTNNLVDNCIIRENDQTQLDGNYVFCFGITNPDDSSGKIRNSTIFLLNDNQSYSGRTWTFESSNRVWNKSGAKVYGSAVNPYNQVDAETFNSKNGGIKTVIGADGIVVENQNSGDYMVFKSMNLGAGALSLQARVAAADTGVKIQFRLDNTGGPIIGTIPVPANGWDTYSTQACNLSGASGTHDLYVIMTPGRSTINWFKFSTATVGALKPLPVQALSSTPKVFMAQGTMYIRPVAGERISDVRVFDMRGVRLPFEPVITKNGAAISAKHRASGTLVLQIRCGTREYRLPLMF